VPSMHCAETLRQILPKLPNTLGHLVKSSVLEELNGSASGAIDCYVAEAAAAAWCRDVDFFDSSGQISCVRFVCKI
jgi:hypothetical protein